MNYIEDILLLNKILSYRTLIYNKFSLKAKILAFSPFLLGIAIMILMLIKLSSQKNLLYFLLLIPSFILWVFSSAYIRHKTKKVIEKHYDYALKENEKWDSNTILKIRKTELTSFLDNRGLLKKDNLIFLIESVKYHSERKHKFNFLWNAVIILVSVYLGGFLSGHVNYYEDLSEFLIFYRNFAIIIGVFIIMAWGIDKTIIKDIIETNIYSRNRLVRSLENIYLEKYAR